MSAICVPLFRQWQAIFVEGAASIGVIAVWRTKWISSERQTGLVGITFMSSILCACAFNEIRGDTRTMRWWAECRECRCFQYATCLLV